MALDLDVKFCGTLERDGLQLDHTFGQREPLCFALTGGIRISGHLEAGHPEPAHFGQSDNTHYRRPSIKLSHRLAPEGAFVADWPQWPILGRCPAEPLGPDRTRAGQENWVKILLVAGRVVYCLSCSCSPMVTSVLYSS